MVKENQFQLDLFGVDKIKPYLCTIKLKNKRDMFKVVNSNDKSIFEAETIKMAYVWANSHWSRNNPIFLLNEKGEKVIKF